MTKYVFVGHQTDFKPFLDDVQEFGLLDVRQRSCDLEGDEKRYLSWIAACSRAMAYFETLKIERHLKIHSIKDERKAFYILKEYMSFESRKRALEIEKNDCVKAYDDHLPWGNFQPQYLAGLAAQGIDIHYYTCEFAHFDPQWRNEYVLETISSDKRFIYFVIITQAGDEKPLVNANEVKLKPLSLDQQLEHIKQLEVQLADIEAHFEQLSVYLPSLQAEKIRLINALEFDRASLSCETAIEDQVFSLSGYLPTENVADFEQKLQQIPVYYFSEAAKEGDDVPIKLKNNRFSKLFEVITNIFSLPLYAELDLTPFFAPFFMLFVGFCLGDAGYGLLFIAGGFFLKTKIAPDWRPIVSLAQWFGLAGMIFGLLSGTFFGIELVHLEALAPIRSYFLTQDNLMVLALAFGAVQILFGMLINIVNVVRRQGFKFAISKIAWIAIILAAALNFGLPELGLIPNQAFQYALYGVLGLSTLTVFLYNSPGKNPFLQIGLGIWDGYNVATGLLGDLLSYIRLFALGLTGSILGSVFNSLAFDLSPSNPIAGPIVTVLILLFGHSLNICLSALGAFVHPLRLTFVEFYKNSGFEGGGRPYEPFYKRRAQAPNSLKSPS